MADEQEQPALKLYRANATAKRTTPGQTAEKTVFVIESPDYKTAWQDARKLTAMGSDHFGGRAWKDETRGEKMELLPGTFTVQEVVSLEKRVAKPTPKTVDDFLAAVKESGVKLPKNVAELVEKLQKEGPVQAQMDEPASDEQPSTGTAG